MRDRPVPAPQLTGAPLAHQVFAHDKAADLLVLKAPAATAGESAMHLVCLSSVKARGGAPMRCTIAMGLTRISPGLPTPQEVLQRTPPPATFSPEVRWQLSPRSASSLTDALLVSPGSRCPSLTRRARRGGWRRRCASPRQPRSASGWA